MVQYTVPDVIQTVQFRNTIIDLTTLKNMHQYVYNIIYNNNIITMIIIQVSVVINGKFSVVAAGSFNFDFSCCLPITQAIVNTTSITTDDTNNKTENTCIPYLSNVGTIKIGPVRSPREPAAMKRAPTPPETVTYMLANVNPLA